MNIKKGDKIADDGERAEHRLWVVQEVLENSVYATAMEYRHFKLSDLIPARKEVLKDAKWECVWNIPEENPKRVVFSRNGLGVWSAELVDNTDE